MPSVADKFPKLAESINCFPIPTGVKFAYGTAGFRTNGGLLFSTMFRTALLASLRSRKTASVIGVMVTASHNPMVDNGVKIIDPDGGMLAREWEGYAADLANSPDDQVISKLDQIIETEKIDMNEFSHVFFGCDTRITSKALIETAIAGCDAIGSLHTDYGVLTTPQLHHCVRMINKDNKALASVEGYNQLVVRSVKELIEGHEYKNRGTLHVDCANGVGFIGWTPLARLLKEYISIELRNTGDGVLNYHCGSEFTQKQQTFPDNYCAHNDKLERCCCMDGDADRLVYFYSNNEEKFCLLDGDKVAALFGLWIHSKLEILKLTDKIKMGVVETSYANGSASEFLRKNNIPLSFAKTGVKFVHHEAQKYDIGIYFEANGHGTAIFNQKTLDLLHSFECKDDTQKRAVRDLLSAYQLINQATGDAMTDALMVECILIQRGITHMDWDKMYTSLPSRQSVLKVPSRYDVVCNDSETACVKPIELQNKINDLCKAVKCGRAFVRPSGTEDVVRIYAEADTQENADKLAQDVMAAAKSILG